MNPIVNQMMSGLFKNNPLMEMFRAVKSAQDPIGTMQSMAQTNPQLKQVLDLVNQNGGNAMQLYYDMCKQKGVDPNIIINNLNNM